jgi:hypothetical protein
MAAFELQDGLRFPLAVSAKISREIEAIAWGETDLWGELLAQLRVASAEVDAATSDLEDLDKGCVGKR